MDDYPIVDRSNLAADLASLAAFAFEPAANPELDPTGRAAYMAVCERIDKESFYRFPNDSVLEKLDAVPTLSLRMCGISDKGSFALAEALRVNQTVTALDVSENGITSVGLEPLLAAVSASKGMRELNLNGNRLGSGTAGAFCSVELSMTGQVLRRFLQSNSTLQELRLANNQLSDRDIAMVADGLMDNTTLLVLDVSQNKIGPGAAPALAAMLAHSQLQEICLQWNRLQDSGAAIILRDGLRLNNTVTSIDLSWNGLADEAAAALASVIDASSALRVINVANNHIGAKGGDTLAKALRTSTTLETFICHDNPLQDDGCAAVLRALRDNSSILHADLRSTSSGLISVAEANALIQGKSADFRLDLTSQ